MNDTRSFSAITEDTKIKTNVKTIVGVSATVIAVTVSVVLMYSSIIGRFESIGGKLDAIDRKQDTANEAMKRRIDYLYRMTNVFNPFEGTAYAPDTGPARTAAP